MNRRKGNTRPSPGENELRIRLHCPHPGCNRSFRSGIWRLKVHYRAPADGRGSGVERGHGIDLTMCPKCGTEVAVDATEDSLCGCFYRGESTRVEPDGSTSCSPDQGRLDHAHLGSPHVSMLPDWRNPWQLDGPAPTFSPPPRGSRLLHCSSTNPEHGPLIRFLAGAEPSSSSWQTEGQHTRRDHTAEQQFTQSVPGLMCWQRINDGCPADPSEHDGHEFARPITAHEDLRGRCVNHQLLRAQASLQLHDIDYLWFPDALLWISTDGSNEK